MTTRVAVTIPEPAPKALRFTVLALSLGAALVFAPLWGPLVLAAWMADLMVPLVRRLERTLGGRRAAAGALSVLVVLSLAVPLFGALIMLALQARDLLLSALHGLAARGALPGVLRTGHTGVEETGLGAVAQEVPSVGALVRDPASVVDWLREHGATLWQVVAGVAGASANAALGAIVFIVALYTFAVHGRRVYAWFVWRSPLGARATRRLVGAFRETGRGLIVGTGGTALAQGALGAITYAALGVPNAIALGALTAMGAFVPAIGTALVWGPVAVGLALAGRPVSAAILAAVGVGIIGTIDNVLRPLLARAGRLRLPAVVLFFAVLGGLDLAGGWGVVLGPLLVRLAVEGLAILRGSTPASSPSHWQGQQP